MEPTDEMCKSLLKWLQTVVPNKSRNIAEVCDGVAMLEALIQISPEYFTKLEPKIKKDVGTNWRLKVSNLKKIAEGITEYYHDILNAQLAETGRPDVNKVGESNDPIQLAKLLRLILGCAINCDRSQEYIETIMKMEESVQQNIMQAIQQLEEVTNGPGGRSALSLMVFENDSRVTRMVSELDAANEEKKALTEQCHSYELQIQTLQEEKRALITENQLLKDKEAKNSDTRKQIEALKEEVFKAEVMRDDFKAKLKEQSKQIITYQEKIADLQVAAKETSHLKDEVDALSESAAKVQELELTLASYKKKLENYTDMKKRLQQLENQNSEYFQKNLQFEEELTKYNGWKSQCETYKQQLSDVQQKLDEETQRADRAQFSFEQLEAKLLALQHEKERLVQERDMLREDNDELRLGQHKDANNATVMSQELTPTEMKERLRFLERENKTLRSSTQEIESKQARLDSALSRVEKLQQQNRLANQQILKLEAKIEETGKSNSGDSSNDSLKEYKQKIASLQELLTAKESELQNTQAKYARSVEKAREVVQHLEPKPNGSIETSLRAQPHMKEKEEQLLVTAFYQMGLSCHREAIDERLAILSAGQGQSFLARQRQPVPRKQFPRYKSK